MAPTVAKQATSKPAAKAATRGGKSKKPKLSDASTWIPEWAPKVGREPNDVITYKQLEVAYGFAHGELRAIWHKFPEPPAPLLMPGRKPLPPVRRMYDRAAVIAFLIQNAVITEKQAEVFTGPRRPEDDAQPADAAKASTTAGVLVPPQTRTSSAPNEDVQRLIELQDSAGDEYDLQTKRLQNAYALRDRLTADLERVANDIDDQITVINGVSAEMRIREREIRAAWPDAPHREVPRPLTPMREPELEEGD